MKKSDEPIIVEQLFNTSLERLWDSLTIKEQMVQWYFDNIPDFKPEIGFKTEFNVKSEERNFLHQWEVCGVHQLKEIEYIWTFEGYHGKSTSKFELSDQNNQTLLRLTVKVLEDFPDDIPEFKIESCRAGWEYFLNGRLKEFLENKM